MALRKRCFARMGDACSVLWRVAADHIPSLEEAGAALDHLRRQGASVFAFTFKQPFAPER